MYCRITSAVTLSPTVRTKYPSSHNSPPHSFRLTQGNSLNTARALKLLSLPHNLRYRIAGWKRTENVHMIDADFHLLNRNVVGFAYLPKQLLHPLRQRPRQQALAILRRPYQMVSRIIGTMRCSSPHHLVILSAPSSWRGHRAHPKIAHSSPPQAVGHPDRFS